MGKTSNAAASNKLGAKGDKARRDPPPPPPPKGARGGPGPAGTTNPKQTPPTTPTSPILRVKIMEWDPSKGMYRIEFLNSWLNNNSTRECFVRFSGIQHDPPDETNPISGTSTKSATNARSDHSKKWTCALCDPTLTFASHEKVTSHLLADHMHGLQKAFEILGQCPRCPTPRAQIELFPAHAIFCYAIKSATASTEADAGTSAGIGEVNFELDIKQMRYLTTQFKGEARISTKQEVQEAAQYRSGDPGSLTIKLVGIDYPPEGIRCEIKYFGLPSVFKSASDYWRLRKDWIEQEGPNTKGVNSLSALGAEIDSITQFLASKFMEYPTAMP